MLACAGLHITNSLEDAPCYILLMLPVLHRTLSHSSLWMIARNVKDSLEISNWERQGRPVPPPFGHKKQVLRNYAVQYNLAAMIETGTLNGEMDFALNLTLSLADGRWSTFAFSRRMWDFHNRGTFQI